MMGWFSCCCSKPAFYLTFFRFEFRWLNIALIATVYSKTWVNSFCYIPFQVNIFTLDVFCMFLFSFFVVFFPFSQVFVCIFGHKLLGLSHCLPIEFSKMFVYILWNGKVVPLKTCLCILSVWQFSSVYAAEVCNFCTTSVTKQKCMNNHCFQTGFPTISQIVWLIQSCCVWLVEVLKQQSNVFIKHKDSDVSFFHSCFIYLLHIKLILASKKLHTSTSSMNVSLHMDCCTMWTF